MSASLSSSASELPREVLPQGGLPSSKINKEWHPPSRPIYGHPAGLPNFNGRVLLTDGFEYLVECPDGRLVIAHVEWFEESSSEPTPQAYGTKRSPRRRVPSLSEYV